MVELGYMLSCEEHGPNDLVRYAAMAEAAGFSYGLISDHYHPWITRQGNSPFVWAVIGGIARETERMPIGTGVTCPTIRIHPAIVAQAAATCALMLEGRFFLGLGSGEYLNEHILGDPWPPVDRRHAMLEEAIEVIRLLWQGGLRSFHGRFYTVENAQIFTRPDTPPPIYVSAHAEKALRLAGRVADGMIGVVAERETIDTFERAGGAGKPKLGQIKVCFGEREDNARRTALEWWPNISLAGQLGQDLALPSHYEAATTHVTEEIVARRVPSGPDPERHLELIRRYADAGYDRVTVHQIGPDQEGFFHFYETEILPRLPHG